MTPRTESIYVRRRQRDNAGRLAVLITVGLVLMGLSASAQDPEAQSGDMPNTSKSAHVARMNDTRSRTIPDILDTFAPVASNAAMRVATVLTGGKPVALATVVDSEGLLLTKASQLGDGDIVCHLADGRYDLYADRARRAQLYQRRCIGQRRRHPVDRRSDENHEPHSRPQIRHHQTHSGRRWRCRRIRP